MATYLPSHKPSKEDGQDMLGTAWEVTFFYGLQHMETLMLADQQKHTSALCGHGALCGHILVISLDGMNAV